MNRFNTLTHKSEKHAMWAAGWAALLGTAAVYMPHTWMLKYVRKTLAAFSEGVEVPVSTDMMNLAQEVLDDIRLDEVFESNIKFFTVNGQELYNRGTCQQRSGAIIGIPPTYGVKTIEEVRDSKLVINNKLVDEDSFGGESLFKSMLLSNRAKKFGIAREIMHTNDNHTYAKSALFTFSSLGAYYTGRSISLIIDAKQRLHLSSRCALYACVGFGFLTLYGLIIDAYECRRDRRSDLWAAKLSKDYALGGIEFYNKALERNMSIRALMGPSGEKCYTKGGNVVPKTLETTVPLTVRRENLIQYFSKYVEEEKKEDHDEAKFEA